MTERSRMSLADLSGEALAGLLQRPLRTFLTMIGTILAVGAAVSVLGLTTTAGSQIDKRFTALAATEVTVEDIGADPVQRTMSFPVDASARIRQLNGVVVGGVFWSVPLRHAVVTGAPGLPDGGAGIGLYAADPDALTAMHPTLAAGRLYDAFHQGRAERVVVLGTPAARRLGIGSLEVRPAVFINGVPYTVIGLIDDLARHTGLLLGVILPSSTALEAYGHPVDEPARMTVETRLGAAKVVAGQLPLALRPEAPERFKATAPLDPQQLRGRVTGDFNALFVVLAAVSLIIGAVGIANTTLVSVMERTAEIGLRRSLGACPRHVAVQFLTESCLLGMLGGLIGTSLGVAVVLAVAIAQQWTAVLQPLAVAPMPLVGAFVGLAAGAYPAVQAARVEPVQALRR